MELLSAEERSSEQFPVGMRVLAVDDNPTCLGKLRDLLLLCKYHVTKTTESKTALEMLREKRNMFDLVIADADTDGFRLLEIGLEMGLPVIMMSAHSDYDSVIKGITHGACDYLIKPVGLKELQNIWQHVVKKNINKYAKSIGPSVSHLPPSISNNQKDKVNDSDREKKDGEGIEHNGQEPFTLKKKKRLRVVWTTELHQKFVTAVEQLGIAMAVPKKIHELMNVEGLTRADVASHLQKYRLCLKHVYEPQQQNMAPDAFGTRDLSYFPKAQLDGRLSSTSLLSRSHLTKLPPSACSSIDLQGINNSSSVTQQDQNSSNSAYPNGTYHQDTLLPRVENVDRFQPTTTPLEPLLFPKGKSSAYMKSIGEFNSCYQINNQQHETAIKFPNISEVTKKDPSCRFPIMMRRFSYGGATRRHRFFFPLMLAAAIALSTFLWFFVSL